MNVLIIADDPYVKAAIGRAVRRFDSACMIFEASSSKEALRLMKSVSVTVVFSEINMPKMNGLSFAEAHKKFFFDVCWIAISEFKNFYDIQKAIRLGAQDYLLKPIDESGLYDLLKYRVIQKANSYAGSCEPCLSCR